MPWLCSNLYCMYVAELRFFFFASTYKRVPAPGFSSNEYITPSFKCPIASLWLPAKEKIAGIFVDLHFVELHLTG